jgi:aminoglycoside phosphotransferase (APT) family kinase protein
VQALGANEASWIKTHAKPRMNYYQSTKDPELPSHALELLEKYSKVTSFLAPASNMEFAAVNTLWHPDLHLDNIFIDPSSHKITAIIDWQSAVVAPLLYQSGIHRAFRHYKPITREDWSLPEKPSNFDTLSPHEQAQVEKTWIANAYINGTKSRL